MIKKKKKRNDQPEYKAQCKIFDWANAHRGIYPELYFLEGSLNGVKLNVGQAVKAKKTGCLKPGRPDIHLPIARSGYTSLYIELKVDGGVVSHDQESYLSGLINFGNYACVCYGADKAIETIERYLKGEIK
jgi:hypothetical protein